MQASVQTAPNGSPYARRHYDITPSTNPSIATATLTLYFTQDDFTTYNSALNSAAPLPINAADVANNKANLCIFQYHGKGTAPGNYTGTSIEVNPADANIIYNGTYSRWEVTFTVSGFIGFYLASAGNQILPLQLISLTGVTDGTNAMLQWKTTEERNVSHFEIERSADAVRVSKVGQLNAGNNNYQFTDQPGVKTIYYYRLKIVDKDDKYTYSDVIAINLKKATEIVQVLPNPFTDKLMLHISAAQIAVTEIRLMDMNGKVILKKTTTLQAGNNAITLNQLGTLAKGSYLLQAFN